MNAELYLECSAKYQENVEDIFREATKRTLAFNRKQRNHKRKKKCVILWSQRDRRSTLLHECHWWWLHLKKEKKERHGEWLDIQRPRDTWCPSFIPDVLWFRKYSSVPVSLGPTESSMHLPLLSEHDYWQNRKDNFARSCSLDVQLEVPSVNVFLLLYEKGNFW